MQKANRLNAMTRILRALFVMLLIPQEIWAQTLSETYIFTGATPNSSGAEGTGSSGGTLESGGITTWTLSGGTITEYRQIECLKPVPLVSSDKFHKVSKITFNVTVTGGNGNVADPEVTFKYYDKSQNDWFSKSKGTGSQNVVLDFSNAPVTVDGNLSINVETVGTITLNRITVAYERTD